MKLQKKILLLFVVLAVSTFLITTCAVDDSQVDTGGTVTILGKLNKNILRTRAISKDISDNVDKLWIMPIRYGNPYTMPDGIEHADYVTINPDGTFEVSVDTSISDNWVLLLLDSTQEYKKQQVLGYVTMGAGNDSLIKLPVNEASGDEIDLGTLDTDDPNGDEVKSSNTDDQNADQFSFTVDQLKKIAKTDDMLKFVKNLYINYNETSGEYYTVLPGFTFRDSQAELIKDDFPDPGDIAGGLYFTTLGSIQFKTNSSAFVEINDNDVISLTPPGPVRMEDYNDSTNYEEYNNGEEIPTNEHSAPALEDGVFQVTFSYFSVQDGYPAGIWKLNKNGEEYAYFDISSTYPVEEVDNIRFPKIYVPVLKVNLENNIIKSIQIKWYVYDETQNPPYSEVLGDDPAIQNSILNNDGEGITITIWSNKDSDKSDEYIRLLGPEDTVVFPTGEWNYNWEWEAQDPNAARGISIGYIMNGMSYTFNWIPSERPQD